MDLNICCSVDYESTSWCTKHSLANTNKKRYLFAASISVNNLEPFCYNN